MYSVCKADGYICGVASGSNISGTAITEEEYSRIKSIICNKPAAPDGYGYRLREDLTWELYELPPVEDVNEDATETDYQIALREMGVNV